MAEMPSAHVSLLMALEEHLEPTRTIILRGPQSEVREWQRRLARHYLPASVTLAIPPGVEPLPAPLAKPVSESVNAWVCEGVTCLAPVGEFEALAGLVSKSHQTD
jgi:hypothetical protein